MTQKSKTRKTEPFAHAETTVTEIAGTARKNYEQAFKAGQKLQEEVAQWWSRMAGQTATAADWQKQFANFTSMVSRVIPLAQKRIEEAMDVMEKNGRTHAELMRKAVDAAQTPGLAQCQNKWMDVWASSMKALQNNVEAYNELGCKALDSWVGFVRDTNDSTSRTAGAAA